ncbi:5'-nucleotidase C-terminal domain-containing protein [Paenibacillus sp. TRM 82003]|nr:5'-nucleotidase C-terminal domain-containing protein [Paenibacillus sp. TRM 82003]
MSARRITILCINDFHAELFATEHAPGCALLAASVAKYMRDNPNTIVVLGGDNYLGDPVSEELDGEPVTYFMQSLGATASAVGNHEFEYGMERLNRWSQEGGYSFVAANVFDRRTGDIADGFAPYVIVEADGIKVALIGLSTVERLDLPTYPEDVRSLEIRDGVRESKRWTAFLREGRDPKGIPDAIVALTHYGFKYAADGTTPVGEETLDLCRQVPDFAGVFTAHWHQFAEGWVSGMPVVQGGGNGRGFATLSLEFTPDRRLRNVVPACFEIGERMRDIVPDERLRLRMEAYRSRTMQTLGAVVGIVKEPVVHKSLATAEVDLEGTPLTKLAVDVMQRETGRRIVLMYSGRMGTGFPKGELTLYQLRKVLFCNDEIVTLKLRGAALLRNLENGICTLRGERASPAAIGGLYIVADYGRPYGARIESVRTEDGEPLELEQEYEIAVDAFLAANEMGYDFSAGTDWRRTGLFLRDKLIAAVREKGGITPDAPGYVTVRRKPKGDAPLC